jgi:hypothetical protein
MSCTLYVQRSEGRIKVVFGRVLLFGENATAHGIPLLHDKVKITIEDIVEDCKHVIISFPIDNKKMDWWLDPDSFHLANKTCVSG